MNQQCTFLSVICSALSFGMDRAYCPTSRDYWPVGKQGSLSCLSHHRQLFVQHLPPQLDWDFSRVGVIPRAQNRCRASLAGMEVGGSVTMTHMHTEMHMHPHTCTHTHNMEQVRTWWNELRSLHQKWLSSISKALCNREVR